MAEAIKKISVARGYDVTRYALNCFGGAGGQHACDVADELAIETVLIHPLSSLLSAYGMGLAEIGALARAGRRRRARRGDLRAAQADSASALGAAGGGEVAGAGRRARRRSRPSFRARLRYAGSDTALEVAFTDAAPDAARLRARAQGAASASSTRTKPIVFESVHAEAHGGGARFVERPATTVARRRSPCRASARGCSRMGAWRDANVYLREDLALGARRRRPGADHRAAPDHRRRDRLARRDHREEPCRDEARRSRAPQRAAAGTKVDPVRLEIFNNLFMSIAEQMGVTLQNTAYSVNIKERLDFSCAVFDGEGALVANAPHMPVHLGSMDRSVETIIRLNPGQGAAGRRVRAQRAL